MTIDEAISQEKEMARTFETKDFAEYHEQVADWLEELKANRIALEKANGCLEANYRLGYNKGIDNLLECANEMAIEVDAGAYTVKAIGIGLLDQIAEQLKAGNSNERN